MSVTTDGNETNIYLVCSWNKINADFQNVMASLLPENATLTYALVDGNGVPCSDPPLFPEYADGNNCFKPSGSALVVNVVDNGLFH